MKDEEKKELEQEYENLKLLASFHEAYGVPENAKEREALINDILEMCIRDRYIPMRV